MSTEATPRPRPQPFPWRTEAALAVLVLALSTSMIGLIDGSGWWLALIGISFAVLAAAAGARLARVPTHLVPIVALATLVAITTGVFGLDIVSLLLRARASIEQQAAPAAATGDLLFLVVAIGGLIAVALDTVAIALNAPAASVFVLAVILVVPSMFLEHGVSPLALIACAAAYLALLRAAARDRGAGPEPAVALAAGAGALAVSLVIGVTAPGFAQVGRQGLVASPFSLGLGVSPLIDLGQNLRRPQPVTMLSYSTANPDPPNLRLTTLDQFTGTVWRHATGATAPVPARGTLPAGAGPAATSQTFTETIHVRDVLSAWLPLPYPAQRVRGLNGQWKQQLDDGTVSAVNTSIAGQNYTVTAPAPDLSAEQLQQAGTDYPASVRDDLFVPFDAPAIIAQTAREATANATSPYQEAVDLQSYFLNSGFVYSTKAPVKQGYDGDSMQAIAAFLTVKEGYCVHFASAMAIMARLLGIPARVAIGYLPGTPDTTGLNGQTTYTVSSNDLHAWPELYFPGIGWIPFNPTVSRGSTPGYSEPGSAASTGGASAAPGATPRARRPLADQAPTAAAAPTSTGGSAGGLLPQIIASAVLIVALLSAPGIARQVKRSRRLRTLRAEWGSAELGWREVADTARDLGIPPGAAQTPRGFAAVLRRRWAPNEPADRALDALLEATERERYGPPGAPPADPGCAGQVRTVLRALRESIPPMRRARAAVLPASLVAGWSAGSKRAPARTA